MRKQIILTLLLTIGLTACVAPIGGASTAPSATVTASPTASETATPTPEATATPTETPTPEVALPADLKITTKFELSKFKDLSELTEAQAESKSFDDFLVKADEQGLLGDFPTGAVPDVPKFNPWGNFYDDGINVVFSESNEMQIQGTYKDLNKRPCYNAAYFQVNINNEDYILFVQKWKNQDGSTGMIKYIYSYNHLKNVPSQEIVNNYNYFIRGLDPIGIVIPGVPGGNPDYKTFWWLDNTYFGNYWPQHKDGMLQRYQELITGRPQQISTNDFSPFLWTPVDFPSGLK